ncbi:MAG: folate family ECF transporter S component [Ruminococcaceae bacterium]|nr:folate family ECF transporter S component [Oscillospiraceae bacterium]
MQQNGFALGRYARGALLELKKVSSIAGGGMLAALGVAIKALYVPLGQALRISFAFLTAGLSGYLYGPVVAGFAAMVVDILGYLIRPEGAYFFGFTFNAFLNGIIYGCWLWRRPVRLWRSFAACGTSIVAVSFLLNPLWLSILYGDAWLGLVLMRIPTNAILLPINSLMLYALLRVAERAKRQFIRS